MMVSNMGDVCVQNCDGVRGILACWSEVVHSLEPGQPEEGIELILLAGEKMTHERRTT